MTTTVATKTLAELAKLNSALGAAMADAKPVGNTAATGTITTVAVASLVDGETFTLDDGEHTAVVFEFDVSGNGVTGGRTAVDVSALTTADDVRDAIIAAIEGLAPTVLTIAASNGGAATVDLVNETPGAAGNTTSAETVTNGTFAVTNMAGGVDFPTVYPASGEGADVDAVTRAVVTVLPIGGNVVFDILGRTEGRTTFEALNNLTDLAASDGIGRKEIVNCGPEVELAVYVKSGTEGTLASLELEIGPCTGGA